MPRGLKSPTRDEFECLADVYDDSSLQRLDPAPIVVRAEDLQTSYRLTVHRVERLVAVTAGSECSPQQQSDELKVLVPCECHSCTLFQLLLALGVIYHLLEIAVSNDRLVMTEHFIP